MGLFERNANFVFPKLEWFVRSGSVVDRIISTGPLAFGHFSGNIRLDFGSRVVVRYFFIERQQHQVDSIEKDKQSHPVL